MPASGSKSTRGVLLVLLLAGLAYSISQTMVVPTIPLLSEHYGSSNATTSWLLTGFLLSASICTPIVGKLGDIYGRARVLTIVLALFAVGSAICALGPSIEWAIAGRVIGGAAGGVFPLAYGIIRESFEAEDVSSGIGTISTAFGIGGGVGLPLSGIVSDTLPVPWLFWTGVAISVPAAIAASRMPRGARQVGVRIDWTGAALLSAALASMLLGVSQGNEWGWTSATTLGLIAVGLILGVAWLWVEGKVAEPLIDLRVLSDRAVAMTNLTGLLVGVAMFSAFLLIPQLAQAPESTGYGFGASILGSGMILLPSALVMTFAGSITAELGRRLGHRTVLALGSVSAVGCFVILALAHRSIAELVIASLLLGIGVAFAMAAMANLIVDAVDPGDVGIATGINTISRTVGGAFGAAAATALLTADTLPSGLPVESGYTASFAMAAVGGVLALLAALAIPRRAVDPAHRVAA